MTAKGKMVSVVAPCYNEEGNVDACYARVRALFVGNDAPLAGYDWELIFCDNASNDDTEGRLRLLTSDPHVKVILNSRNFGPSPSAFNGCFAASGDVVVLQSSDLQDPPEMIPEYVRLWEAGNQVVFGIRSGRRDSFLLTQYRKVFYRIFDRLAPTPMTPQSCPYLMARIVVNAIKAFDDYNPLLRGLIPLMGFKSATIGVPVQERTSGRSSFNFFSYLDEAINTFIRLSPTPLRFSLVIGFLLSGMSLVAGLGILAWGLFDLATGVRITTPGFRTFAVGGLFLFGIQMFFIGIIGEYVGAIHAQVRKGPLVIERERINFNLS
ncbi:MAG: glycosyltransferase family 2 protein [Desulfuromonadales bacterium]